MRASTSILQIIGFALIAGLNSAASAQDAGVRSLWFFDGSIDPIKYETDLTEIHDFDHDGVRDILIGQWENYGGSKPKFAILSGASGMILYSELALERFAQFGRGVGGIGDQNGDQIDDFLIGVPGGNSGLGRVELRSGADASMLATFLGSVAGQEIGRRVAGVGDVDGDGRDDFAYAGGGTFVQSGATGATLHRFPSGTFTRIDDLNGDGYADLVIGYPSESMGGALVAFSGASGNRIWHYESDQPNESLGISVIGVGDINGDGASEVLAGASEFDAQRGRALLFDGATGKLLQAHYGRFPKDRFGYSLANPGDLNGDGKRDYVIGAHRRRSLNLDAYVALVDGSTHSLLALIRGNNKGNFASDIVAPGDIDGDGQSDIVVVARNWGHATAYGYNRVLEADRNGLASKAGEQTELRINFGPSESKRHYAILASRTGLGPTTINGFEVPLSDDELLRAMASGRNVPGSTSMRGLLDASGRAQAKIAGTPFLASFAGRQVHLCAISFDRFGAGFAGRDTSTPLTLTVLP